MWKILEETPSWMAIDKPPDLICHPGGNVASNTLIHQLRDHFSSMEIKPTLVNRLDRETSGIILVAKNDFGRNQLGRQMETKGIKKRYQAIVHGVVPAEPFTIDLPIGKAKQSPIWIKQECYGVDAVPARTHVRQMEATDQFSLVSIETETGRLHQIRVHLAAVHFPIVGDKMYGQDELDYLRFIEQGLTGEMLSRLLLPRHALHASEMTFTDPESRQSKTVFSPLPEDLEEFWKKKFPASG